MAFALLLCLLYPVLLAVFHPALMVQVHPSPDRALLIWKSGLWWRAQALLWLPALLLPLGTWWVTRACRGETDSPRRGLARANAVLLPLALLPLAAPGFLLYGRVRPEITGNLVFYLPVLVVALMLLRTFDGLANRNVERTLFPRSAILVVAGMSLLYILAGIYFTDVAGPHVGDEGFYILQAESLYHDHDLDLKRETVERVGPSVLEGGIPVAHSISPNSRRGKWYGWHPAGLPILLAPFVPGGVVARHIVLGLFAGLACGAMWLLSLRLGAGRRVTFLVLGLFWLSVFWFVYAARCLPETLGACLLLWLVWAVFAQRDYPRRTLCIATVCGAYLPWAHTRFLPLSLMGLGLYGLGLLTSDAPWSERVRRAAGFTALVVAGYGMYYGFMFYMFKGGSGYWIKDILFSYLPGAWAALADTRGLLHVLPVFAWLVLAQFVLLRSPGPSRWYAMAVVAILMAGLMTSSTNAYFRGGATLPGRFLLVTVPLLLPGAVLVFERSGPAARLWFLFLALFSVALTILVIATLHDLGPNFKYPTGNIPEVVPVLRGLLNPHCYYAVPGKTPGVCGATTLYVLLLFGFTALLLFTRKLSHASAVAGFLVVATSAAIAHFRVASHHRPYPPDPPRKVATVLSSLNLESIRVPRAYSPETTPLGEMADRFREATHTGNLVSVTTADSMEHSSWTMMYQPEVEVNDWAGRPFRWCTLFRPFTAGKGWRYFELKGRVEGDVTPVLAIRQGSATLLETELGVETDGAVQAALRVECPKERGHLYILLRLTGGTGTFWNESMHWIPFSERLLEQGHFSLAAAP